MSNFIIKEHTIKSELFNVSPRNIFTFDEECNTIIESNFFFFSSIIFISWGLIAWGWDDLREQHRNMYIKK